MLRFFLVLLGGFFFLFGIIGVLTPIPLGLLFLVLGASLLIAISHRFRRSVGGLRRRSRLVDNSMDRAERYTPRAYRRVLRSTRVNDWDRRMEKL